MITALHTLVYAEDPDAARAFFRDVLQLPGADTGGGWLIFKSGPSELGVHPSSWEYQGQSGATDQRFDVSLMCDDLAATMAELTGRGAAFDGDVVEEPWGSTVQLIRNGTAAAMEAIRKIIAERKVDLVVVGLPIHEDETQAKRVKRFTRKLRQGTTGVRWRFVDETLTSEAARDSSVQLGTRSPKKPIDDSAAALILESFLSASA